MKGGRNPPLQLLCDFYLIHLSDSGNDFINPLTYLHKEPQFTAARVLRLVQGRMSNNMQDLMAASLIAVLPTLIIFFFAQRYILESVVVSGLKG